jgi:hypothetical protein
VNWLLAPLGGSTVAIGALDAWVDPPLLLAVTADFNDRPTSLACGTYLESVAPVILVHVVSPQPLQLYVNDVGLLLHVPFVVLSGVPCCATVGVSTGGV